MTRPIHVFGFIVLLSMIACPEGYCADKLQDQVSENLRSRIEILNVMGSMPIGQTEQIYARNALPRFYERRAFQPAWINKKTVKTTVDSLVSAIKGAYREGLCPEDYHLVEIEKLVSWIRTDVVKSEAPFYTDLEMLCTDAFLILGNHYLSGKVDPITIDSHWFANRREADMTVILDSCIELSDVAEVLHALLPKAAGYNLLKQHLLELRQIQKQRGWACLDSVALFEIGVQDERLQRIRERLAVNDDLVFSHIQSSVYDQSLINAVMRFQKRTGLEPNGFLTKQTLQELSVSVENRIKQIEVNLERWRWLPQQLGSRYLLVNVANFEIDLIQDGSIQFSSRVIVGKAYRKTPVFSDQITYLVFNPYWHVPQSIAIQDILPIVKRDPNYFKDKNMCVFDGYGSTSCEIDPNTIDWSLITEGNFSYRFRQDPGPQNALGIVKFMFPNQFNVYMHDTPSRELFEKTERTFSSGCIRVENAYELALLLLKDDDLFEQKEVDKMIQNRIENTVHLNTPVPIHLLYWTAWVDLHGVLQLRRDIYDRDEILYQALKKNIAGSVY